MGLIYVIMQIEYMTPYNVPWKARCRKFRIWIFIESYGLKIVIAGLQCYEVNVELRKGLRMTIMHKCVQLPMVIWFLCYVYMNCCYLGIILAIRGPNIDK